MNTVHRRIGRFKKRTDDENEVSVLLKDYSELDNFMGKVRISFCLLTMLPLLTVSGHRRSQVLAQCLEQSPRVPGPSGRRICVDVCTY